MAIQREVGGRVIRLVVGDITDVEVDAFVYDITEDVQLGAGYGGAITGRAGRVVQDALDEIGKCPTGEAVLTTAGKMKAEHIIHTNGPKFHEPDTEAKLQRSIDSALQIAAANNIGRLAVPPIGTGLYQVPIDLCARILVDRVTDHLGKDTPLQEVLFVALNSREYAPFEAAMNGGA